MIHFLERIAKKLYTDYGSDLHKHCLVFPGRRAGLYFLKYLSAEINEPLWTPSIKTINDLFLSLSELRKAENEILLFELYRKYIEIKKINESFDNFYFWGDMLLNDFDDIDKYLVDTSHLFRNIKDMRMIEEKFDDLTQEQAEALRKFWINFDPGRNTQQKSSFIEIWAILNELYTGFRQEMKKKNLAYEGMIFRDVIENIDTNDLSWIEWDYYHFIGFNALNECEKKLMLLLKNAGKARFYWDYDIFYMKETKVNSAGFFLKDNLRIFGNDMPHDWTNTTYLSEPATAVRRTVIETSSDIAQVKIMSDVLMKLPGMDHGNGHFTAVIPADENLLIPVLTSIPETLKDINITMGYPLKQTRVYVLLCQLLDIQRNARLENGTLIFGFRDVLKLSGNSWISALLTESDKGVIKEISSSKPAWIRQDIFISSEILKLLFSKKTTPESLSEYLRDILYLVSGKISNDISTQDTNIMNECIYRVILSLNRLDSVIKNSGITLSIEIFIKLLERLIKKQSIPFSGEPLSGIQVMGILETRALDFRNLIILSVNEGVLPAVTVPSSFVPFTLREGFGLPAVNHRESIYAYHFYRLLHRAENVVFIYNSSSEGLRTGEMSRFLYQMKYDIALKPEVFSHALEIKNFRSPDPVLLRQENHSELLKRRFSCKSRNKILSPSAINTWLTCRMRFYYRYVNGLYEPEVVADEIDPAMLGTLLHASMRELYVEFLNKPLQKEIIESLYEDDKKIQHLTEKSIKDKYWRKSDQIVVGNEHIVKEVIKIFIKRILETDSHSAPFIISALEKPVSFRISPDTGNDIFDIQAGGTIDRIDVKDGLTRIVDYKTGSMADSISSIEDLFKDERKKDISGWLQVLLYCESVFLEKPDEQIQPMIYKIKNASEGMNSSKLHVKSFRNEVQTVDNYLDIRDMFMKGLISTVNKIFSDGEPFTMTSNTRDECPYCPYRILCMR